MIDSRILTQVSESLDISLRAVDFGLQKSTRAEFGNACRVGT